MATVNKNFKVKNGLVVEGTTATVNGNQVLTENSSDQYIIDLIGGETLITSVESTQMEVIAGELNIKSGVFDVDGAAAQALIDANDHTDTALLDYTTTANLDTTVAGYGYLKNADLPTMYSDADVDAHLSGGDGITYSAGTISADLGTGLEITGGQIVIDRTETDTWYDASGAASDVASDLSTHEGLTSGVHGVTGSVVGTTDTQDLSNKRIIDTLNFSDGVTIAQEGEIAVKAVTHEFEVKANDGDLHLITIATGADVNITAEDGSIVLNAGDGAAYYGSASAENEIATHGYVDNAISGLNWKQAVNLLSTTPISLGSPLLPFDLVGTVIDGHAAFTTANNGYRILLTGQSDASQNGIYELLADGAALYASRPADANSYDELIGAAVYVMEGTQYGSTSWVQGDHYLTDFSGQDWTQFSGQGSVTAGTGIVVDGLEVSVDFTVVAEVQDLTDGLALKQDSLTVGDGLDLTSGSLTVVPAEMIDKIITGVSGSSYGLVGNATYLEVDNTNGYNKEIDVNIAAIETTLDADGYAKQTDISSAITALDLSNTYDAKGAAAQALIDAEAYADALTTDEIAEGTLNRYYTDLRAKSQAANLLTDAIKNNIEITYDTLGQQLTITAENGVADSTTNDLVEGTDNSANGGTGNNLYFTDARAVDAITNATIYPTVVDINDFRREEATQQYVSAASTVNVHTFAAPYESVKYLVRVVGNVGGARHSQLSEILFTVDGGNNIAITEYGITHTSNEPLASFSGTYDPLVGFNLTATTAVSGCEIIAAATMLSWAD